MKIDAPRKRLLAKAFNAEVDAGLSRLPLHIIQTKAQLADAMVNEGLLARRTVTVSGVTVKGFELTHAGRIAYCEQC